MSASDQQCAEVALATGREWAKDPKVQALARSLPAQGWQMLIQALEQRDHVRPEETGTVKCADGHLLRLRKFPRDPNCVERTAAAIAIMEARGTKGTARYKSRIRVAMVKRRGKKHMLPRLGRLVLDVGPSARVRDALKAALENKNRDAVLAASGIGWIVPALKIWDTIGK